MINKSYKIWILFFVIINLFLLAWSLGYLKFLEKKLFTQDNIIVIEPENTFNKTFPPKDQSFPNVKSKVWGAFENKNNKAEISKNNLEEENDLENKNNKLENKNNKLENFLEDNDNDSEDIKKVDIKPSIKNNIVEKKNSTEEKKLKSDLKTKEDQVTNNGNLEARNSDTEVILYVQVASLSKKELVEKEWIRFKKKYTEYMINMTYISQKAELKDNRIFFRLLVGKFKSKKEANKFCKKLGISKCIIKKVNE